MCKEKIKIIRVTDKAAALQALSRLLRDSRKDMEVTPLVYPRLGLREEIIEDRFGNIFYETNVGNNMEITIENICKICERQGCETPCEKWYDCLEDKSVDFGIISTEQK